jgi:hypothetical protein
VERQARDAELSFDEIKTLRQEKSVEVLGKLEKYLTREHPNVLPQSAIGKAFNYTLNLWPRLKRYVEDGRFQINNNLIENSIRPWLWVMHRKRLCKALFFIYLIINGIIL